MRRALVLGGLLACLGAAPRAWAHPARASAVFVDVGEDAIVLALEIPVDQLGAALGEPGASVADLLRDEAGLRAYLAEHVGATTPAGEPFAVAVGALSAAVLDGAEHLTAEVALRPPRPGATEQFTLTCDPVLHRVVSHKLLVSVRRDFAHGVFAEAPEPVGVLRYQHDSLEIDRRGGSLWTGARAMAEHGARHIAEGVDHLLFVLVLLVSAPLAADGGRWRARPSIAAAIRRILVIVSAFTLGHSLTLVLGALGVVHLPSRPVEILIALSILASAVHAIRPIFAGREAWVAAGFGLIHGLAFATALADLGVGGVTLVASVLAFNLGVELAQVAIILATIPWLLLLRDAAIYTGLRGCIATFAAVMALGWTVERALDVANPVAPAAAALLDHPLLFILPLATLALGRAALRRRVPLAQAPAAQPGG